MFSIYHAYQIMSDKVISIWLGTDILSLELFSKKYAFSGSGL